MFMARLVEHPKDILVFGRGIATHYRPGIDDATKADIQERGFKNDWPHYIRVHNTEFVRGPFSNGVSLKGLMNTLGPDSYFVTQRNAARGRGNTEPRKSLMQQAAVRLSAQGHAWLNRRLEESFEQHGRITQKQMKTLDWPG